MATEFPNIEVWDHLEKALRHSLRWYNPTRGTYDKLFEKTLRERLEKAEARAAITKRRRQNAEAEYAIARTARTSPDERSVGFYRWASLLLDRACDRLDHRTHAFLLMRRSGVTVADIALNLGTTEQSLKNQYGGQKVAMKVKHAVRQMVLELTDWQRRLLVRHLLENVELQREQVQALLGVEIDAEGVPVLPEAWLLKIIGWEKEKTRNLRNVRQLEARTGSMYCNSISSEPFLEECLFH
ncbi:MAG: hypothetical protein K8U57_29490 [Planctomycetes bacterium]|nr:hypothetical protein [Planctomycetota bacterium]